MQEGGMGVKGNAFRELTLVATARMFRMVFSPSSIFRPPPASMYPDPLSYTTGSTSWDPTRRVVDPDDEREKRSGAELRIQRGLKERTAVLRAWTRPKQEGLHVRSATTVGCLHVLRQRRRKRHDGGIKRERDRRSSQFTSKAASWNPAYRITTSS
ncbi:hypothetical protein DBV15_06701 [Temnothorax longispinosus]|uniref:Uncharacterized protein n=1 Tax=Temnothorax longispinosus TaxID=300112 RepID=A0A4S2KZ02_9HYME|nr:hypothetical protein DBV15_06701 [Temnothorax longispinosus]